MGKIKKKGTAGAAKNYVTRSQAVRKLQISLPDFRRLCIFKGIYPREPRQKKKVNSSATPLTTFYYAKDIQYLLHEPLLAKFREHKAVSKKIARSLGRGEVGDAVRHEKSNSTRLPLDHIIKERYPTFIDALRDLDDALSLLFLFANLPSTSTVPSRTIALCQRLCLEFEHYLITTHSLRKSFLSIKGIYYQATIQGQDIMWLAPYKFVQRVTGDVDFRIMGTFVEFYTTLLGFVNYRLYTSVGLVYPPKFNSKIEELGGELSAFMLEGRGIEDTKAIEAAKDDGDGADGQQELPDALQKQIQGIHEPKPDSPAQSNPDADDSTAAPEPDNQIEKFPAPGPESDVLPIPAPSSESYSALFASTTIFLSRETPKSSLEFLLRAFGCKRIGWPEDMGDGAYTTNEFDPSITHQVVDRPLLPTPPPDTPPDTAFNEEEEPNSNGAAVVPRNRNQQFSMLNRVYIQPQWVWDSINNLRLLRPDHYAPGAELPPHLSPWVKPKKGVYDPTIPLAEQEREGEAETAALEGAAAAAKADDMQDEDKEGDSAEESDDALAAAEDDEDHDDDDDDDEDRDETAILDALAEEENTFPPLDLASSSPSGSNRSSRSSSFAGFDRSDASDDDNAAAALLHQRELEAEAAGAAPGGDALGNSGRDGGVDVRGGSGSGSGSVQKQEMEQHARRRKKEARMAEEELERRKMMMPRRKRKVLEKMLYSNKEKEGEAERLRGKRRRIEAEAAKKKA